MEKASKDFAIVVERLATVFKKWVMLLTLETHPALSILIITQRDIELMSSSSSPAGSGDTVTHIRRRITITNL